MAENQDGQEKSEQATSKKLDESRDEGQVAKSMEINSLAIFTTGLLVLFYTKSYIGGKLWGIATYIFSSLGIPIFYADTEAKKLMLKEPLKSQIINLLGKNAYTQEGLLNKKHIANIIFSQKEKLQQINAILHPAIESSFDTFAEKQKAYPYIIKEAAILIENKMYQSLDKIILLVSDEKRRVQRVIKRDNLTQQEVMAKIKNQMSDEEKKQYANFIIYNNETELLIPQVINIHQKLINK